MLYRRGNGTNINKVIRHELRHIEQQQTESGEMIYKISRLLNHLSLINPAIYKYDPAELDANFAAEHFLMNEYPDFYQSLSPSINHFASSCVLIDDLYARQQRYVNYFLRDYLDKNGQRTEEIVLRDYLSERQSWSDKEVDEIAKDWPVKFYVSVTDYKDL